MILLPMTDFIDRIKVLPQPQAEAQVRAYLEAFVGEEERRSIIRNRFRRVLKEKARAIR